MGSTSEIKRLRSCINDLVSVLALPAIWSGGESSHILDTLLDTLVTMMRLDFAYARLNPSDGPRIEAVRLADHRHSSVQLQPFGQALDRWVSGDQNDSRLVVPNPVGDGEVSIVSFLLGLQHQGAVLVAGSRRAEFPTEVERLLLRVAANQAGIGLQEAQRSSDQKRIAAILEERVAERTARLTALNEQLRHSEAYLAEAQKLSQTGSFGWRPSTGKIVWSEETFRIFQYEPTMTPTVELVLHRVHPEDATLVQQTIERASQDGKDFELEHRLLMPDGCVKHLHVVARALSNESGDVEFIGAVMDVTAAKQTEEALRRSEGYLAQAQTLTQSGSWAWNVRTDARFWSQETFHIFEYDPKKGHPTWSDILERTHPEDRVALDRQAKLEARQKKVSEFDWRIVLPDGRIKHLHSIAHPVLDESGEVTEVVGTLMDVTERKRADEERERLRQVQADFAHLSRVTTMGELTASLAHEIRQPISAAVTNAKTCLRWLDRDTPDLAEAREAAARIIKDVMRAAEIISSISLLFKKGARQRELVDVNELIREMIVLLRSEANRYSISIRTDLAEGLPKVKADRVQLQQVFMNLMLNGIDAMKETTGGGELIIESEADDAQLLISVSDTGVGLPPEQADQIFRAFFTTKDNGIGMGLPISRSIVESYGGRLWAAGNSAQGTTFQFTLPTKFAGHA